SQDLLLLDLNVRAGLVRAAVYAVVDERLLHEDAARERVVDGVVAHETLPGSVDKKVVLDTVRTHTRESSGGDLIEQGIRATAGNRVGSQPFGQSCRTLGGRQCPELLACVHGLHRMKAS